MSRIQNLWKEENQTVVEKRSDCCGCDSCATKCPKQAITMQYDDEGFLYPRINTDLCVSCGACVRACPLCDEQIPNADYLSVYAGYTPDKEILAQTTSGGFATQLALSYVQSNGIVVGVSYAEDLIHARYEIAETEVDVLRFAGSKYVQSEKYGIYTEVEARLKAGAKVLFTGCPCDIHALHKYLGRDYENLCTVELVCMGVSTPSLAEDYVAYAEKKNRSKLVSINARSKRKGWFVPHLEEQYENGKIKCHTLFGTYLGYGMQVYNRPSCFSCKFRGTSGSGDIRIGDFWGIHDTDPYWNADGVCCIFARTEKGMAAIRQLERDGYKLFKADYRAATMGNMSSVKNKSDTYVQRREKFSRVYRKRGLIAACRATGTVSFWSKRIIPERWHASVKKMYHTVLDRK